MNLETHPNGAKFVHPTTVGTPRPTQIFGVVVKQIRSKSVANNVSDCVLLPHKIHCVQIISFYGATAPSGPGHPDYPSFTITLRHTTLGTSLDG